jgi:hypothetical protein
MAESKQLKIISLNMRGFNQGRQVVDDLMKYDRPDIFLLQEHWLTPANLNLINSLKIISLLVVPQWRILLVPVF